MLEINNELKNFLEIKFNKKFDSITQEEYDTLDTIAISNENDDSINFFNIFKMFKNIKSISISNYYISQEDILLFSKNNIHNIYFKKCKFQDLSNLYNISLLENVSFENCIINDYSFLKNDYISLISLSIINPSDEGEIELKNINADKLKILVLENCMINDFENINIFKSCEIISILNTFVEKEKLYKLNELPHLKKLYINENRLSNDLYQILIGKIEIKYNLFDMLYEE